MSSPTLARLHRGRSRSLGSPRPVVLLAASPAAGLLQNGLERGPAEPHPDGGVVCPAQPHSPAADPRAVFSQLCARGGTLTSIPAEKWAPIMNSYSMMSGQRWCLFPRACPPCIGLPHCLASCIGHSVDTLSLTKSLYSRLSSQCVCTAFATCIMSCTHRDSFTWKGDTALRPTAHVGGDPTDSWGPFRGMGRVPAAGGRALVPRSSLSHGWTPGAPGSVQHSPEASGKLPIFPFMPGGLADGGGR